MHFPRCRVLFFTAALSAVSLLTAAQKSISVLWAQPISSGHIHVDRGVLESIDTQVFSAEAQTGTFRLVDSQRLRVSILPIASTEKLPTLVTLTSERRGFTFRLEDVSAAYPIFLPGDGVVITESADQRDYAAIVAAIQQRGGQTKLQRIAHAPEASFETSAASGREIKEQTWLGLSRDMRIFWIDQNLETIRPKFAGYDVKIPELPKQPATYGFQFGRGWGAREALKRSLEAGALPILKAQIDDESMHYDVTLFTSLERSALTPATLRGTDYLVADAFGHGHMFTPAQAEAEKNIHETELNPGEETVMYARAVATNQGKAPSYAFFKTAAPTLATPISPRLPEWKFDSMHGFGVYESGQVFAISRLNGQPLPAEEVSVLIKPGESAVMEFFLPHRPVSRERALALTQQSFETRHAEARKFWAGKLATASSWHLPEPRIQEMVRAGLLHLDLINYGREPTGPLLPAIGLYTAIGSESAPIIQFMDSMGWHDTAARALEFFLKKQHDSGFIQNFNGYMLETGAVLWTLGEHYRYTRDDAWLQRVHPHITKACDYLIAWRKRNQLPELRGKGHGLLDGKTADPEDPYRSYMLNGYAYLGLARAAEALRQIAPEESARYLAIARELKADIRLALTDALEKSPVVPLGDGTWLRAAPPWTNYRGPVMLHADGGKWFTHGSMTSRDSLLGPLYLVFQEVIAPDESIAKELLETHSELATRDNVAFSQPYYSRHPWVHLQRGETKAFLQAWYASVAALADRETYTFTEHFFPVSAHKTHEEAWFLMETRWMLYLESGDTLKLFSGIPRAYFKAGAKISVENAGSYFGPLSFSATVSADGKDMKIAIECGERTPPRVIEIRLPHPDGKHARSVEGGDYLPEKELVRVDNFTGRAEVVLRF
ncbi:hypothetical protein [Oleiharenicola lentus]|uniref:hypothetical protein n=1 Tax=Oleiharenicola lentus TaxID=2508720 RepID=UPI003F669C13